jgi:hypothetical protein
MVYGISGATHAGEDNGTEAPVADIFDHLEAFLKRLGDPLNEAQRGGQGGHPARETDGC